MLGSWTNSRLLWSSAYSKNDLSSCSMSLTLFRNQRFCFNLSKIFDTSFLVTGSIAICLSMTCWVLSKALPSIEWLYMLGETLEVNSYYNYFLLKPYMKPGITYFNAGQNNFWIRVNNPQYYLLGLQMVLGRSDTFPIVLLVILIASVL